MSVTADALMDPAIRCVHTCETVQVAAQKMVAVGAEALPICDTDHTLRGSLTCHDIAAQVVAAGRDAARALASEFADAHPVAVDVDGTADQILAVMANITPAVYRSPTAACSLARSGSPTWPIALQNPTLRICSTPPANLASHQHRQVPMPDSDMATRPYQVPAGEDLFKLLARTEPGTAEWTIIRDQLVERHLPLASNLARRYAHRPGQAEDLAQVAAVGLIKAINRFDPDRGLQFSTYAAPTIVGELKRHLRDTDWLVRPPRRLQETGLRITAETENPTQELGRQPTVRELAGLLDLNRAEVQQGLAAIRAHSAVSLDAEAAGRSEPNVDDPQLVKDTIGTEDPALEQVENRAVLRPLLTRLTDREKQILRLRLLHDMRQSQIARQISISQPHVSLILSRTLKRLHERLGANRLR